MCSIRFFAFNLMRVGNVHKVLSIHRITTICGDYMPLLNFYNITTTTTTTTTLESPFETLLNWLNKPAPTLHTLNACFESISKINKSLLVKFYLKSNNITRCSFCKRVASSMSMALLIPFLNSYNNCIKLLHLLQKLSGVFNVFWLNLKFP